MKKNTAIPAPKLNAQLISQLNLPTYFKNYYQKFQTLTAIQNKAVKANLLEKNSILVCAPTASGKTLIATMAICNTLNETTRNKAIYLVPLKALANEKFKEYKKLLEDTPFNVTIATGDIDSESRYLSNYDLLILTTEKLDSLMRHQTPWLQKVKTVVIDEIHLLNSTNRGPTLEIVLTILKERIKPQLIGLSATIGNPKDLANWLNMTLVSDTWRPITLKKGIYHEKELEFY